MTDGLASVGAGQKTAHTPSKGQLRSAPAGWCCKVKMQGHRGQTYSFSRKNENLALPMKYSNIFICFPGFGET